MSTMKRILPWKVFYTHVSSEHMDILMIKTQVRHLLCHCKE